MSHRRLRAAASVVWLAVLVLCSSSAHAGTFPAPRLGPVEQARAGAPLERRVLTILANFQEDRASGSGVNPQPFSVAEAEDAMGIGDDGLAALGAKNVRNLFWQASSEQFDLVGDVTPWVQLGSRGSGCDRLDWINAAIAGAAAQTSFDPSTYDAVSVISRSHVAGQTDPCDKPGFTPADGKAWSGFYGAFPRAIAAHEIGHTLGLSHADTLACTFRGTPVVVAEGCPSNLPHDPDAEEYGDADSVQGSGVLRLHSAVERAQIGFLPLDRVAFASANDEEYTIDRLGPSLPTNKALVQVQRPLAAAAGVPLTARAWMLEYRKASAPFDDFLPADPATTRVAVRLAQPLRDGRGSTRKVVPRPGSGSPKQNANFYGGLGKGQSIHDPVENYTITVTDLTAEQAKIRVTPDPSTLTASTATQVLRSGGTLTVVGASGKSNSVAVYEDRGAIIVSDAAQPVLPGAGCRKLNSGMAECTATNLSGVTLQLGDGDDYASVEDTITAPVRATGGPGNDEIDTAGGRDTFLTASGDGNDKLDGGPGTDAISYADRGSAVTVTSAGGGQGAEADAFADIENVTGTAFADVIDFTADASANRIEGGGGADTLKSGGGDDVIVARDGSVDTAIDCGSSANDLLVYDGGEPTSNCEELHAAPQPEFTGGIAEGAVTSVRRPSVSFTAPQLGTAALQCAVVKAGATVSYGSCSGATSHQPAADLDPANASEPGEYEVWVRAVQGGTPIAGAVAIKRTFTVRTAAPETSFVTQAPNPARATNSSFEFGSEAGATFECSLDLAAYMSCASSMTFAPLTSGSHTLAVRAVSAAGVTDSSPSTYQWTVDADNPETTISGTPASGATAAAGSLNWTFSSDDPTATFKCSWSSQLPDPCGGSTDGAKEPGTYTFKVVATDSAGNSDPTPATRVVTILPQGFDTEIQNPAAEVAWVSNARKPTLQFAVAPAATGYTFECKVEGAGWTPCQSPYQPTFVQEGYQAVLVRAISPQGVVEVTPANEYYFVDLTAPDTTITSSPAQGSTISTDSATFSFSAPEGDSVFSCQLDTQSWQPCTSPKQVTGLANGSRRFRVASTDQAGNTDATPATVTYTVNLPQVLDLSTGASTPTSVSLSSDSALGSSLDWIHWNSVLSSSYDRKDAAQRIVGWSPVGITGNVVYEAGNTTFQWSDAVGTAAGSSTFGVGKKLTDGRGLRITTSASWSEARKLRIYVGVRGTTTVGTLSVAFGSGTPITRTVTGTSATTPVHRTFDIDYRPATSTETLGVEFTQTAGGNATGSAVYVYAAALY